MKKLFLLFDKYKSFEDNLKQERLWLFIPLYIIKTALKYTVSLALAYIICFIVFKSNDIINTYIGFLFLHSARTIIVLILSFISVPVSYILLFSRKKITLHPYIAMFIAVSLLCGSAIKGLFYMVEFFIATTIVTIVHALILWLLKKLETNPCAP